MLGIKEFNSFEGNELARIETSICQATEITDLTPHQSVIQIVKMKHLICNLKLVGVRKD